MYINRRIRPRPAEHLQLHAIYPDLYQDNDTTWQIARNCGSRRGVKGTSVGGRPVLFEPALGYVTKNQTLCL